MVHNCHSVAEDNATQNSNQWPYRLPILFVVCLEVVHVTALSEVHGVLSFSLLGLLDVNQVAGVLDHELALEQVAAREDTSALKTRFRKSGYSKVVAAGRGIGFYWPQVLVLQGCQVVLYKTKFPKFGFLKKALVLKNFAWFYGFDLVLWKEVGFLVLIWFYTKNFGNFAVFLGFFWFFW